MFFYSSCVKGKEFENLSRDAHKETLIRLDFDFNSLFDVKVTLKKKKAILVEFSFQYTAKTLKHFKNLCLTNISIFLSQFQNFVLEFSQV